MPQFSHPQNGANNNISIKGVGTHMQSGSMMLTTKWSITLSDSDMSLDDLNPHKALVITCMLVPPKFILRSNSVF
jgi:hypothetical protein